MFKGDLNSISSHLGPWEVFTAEKCLKPGWGKRHARPLNLRLHT